MKMLHVSAKHTFELAIEPNQNGQKKNHKYKYNIIINIINIHKLFAIIIILQNLNVKKIL